MRTVFDGASRCHPRRRTVAATAFGAVALVLLTIVPAAAQSLNDLTGALGKSGGALGGLGLPAVDQASLSNLARVLQYCAQHKYLGGGGDAKAVGQSLLGKAGGSGAAAADPGFKAGSGGLLETGGGQTFGLGGDGLQATITDQVCDLVLQHAQSLL